MSNQLTWPHIQPSCSWALESVSCTSADVLLVARFRFAPMPQNKTTDSLLRVYCLLPFCCFSTILHGPWMMWRIDDTSTWRTSNSELTQSIFSARPSSYGLDTHMALRKIGCTVWLRTATSKLFNRQSSDICHWVDGKVDCKMMVKLVAKMKNGLHLPPQTCVVAAAVLWPYPVVTNPK